MSDQFDLSAWNVEIRQALAPIDILQALLTDEHIVEFLKPRLKGVSHLSNYPEASDEYLFEEVGIAHQVYLRQMIVLATTYMELILKDFFYCLFIAQPLRMNVYLSPEGNRKAMVALNEILNTDSKEQLVINLAEQAASVAVGPRFDKVVHKIIKECKFQLDRPFVEDLRVLNELRNQIVHEDKIKAEVSIEQVHDSIGLLLYLLYVLGQSADKYQMPYLDEFGFMDDFEKQLREE